MGKITKVISCLVVIGILMSVVAGAVVASEDETASKTNSNLKVGVMSAEVSANSVTISNEYLTMTVYPDGNFRGYNATGECIFYPAATSDLTIKIGSNEYSVYHGSLDSYRTKDTYVNPNNDKEAVTEWDLPAGIHVEQHIRLEGDHVVFTVTTRNNGNSAKDVSVRYLWDTQLCDNDGSPLKAKGTLYTKEMCFEPVDFNHWSAYSRPDESEAELVTYGWWANKPDKIIFAHWPNAIDSVYSYNWDPNRQFYTPGYVTSPESDSCVLMYWENINIPANGEKSITAYYGTSLRVGLTLSMKLDKTEYKPNEMMKIYVKAIDADGNSNYPLTQDNTEVRIDADTINIEDIIPQPNGEYLIKVKAPSDGGDHVVWVQVVTDQGSASNSKSFSVSGEVPTGTVSVSLNGNVNDSTKDWKYPAHYNAPVFRRGTDNPTFILTLDSSLPSDYEPLFEIYAPNMFTPVVKLHPNICAMEGFTCCWGWNTDYWWLNTNTLPIGVYTVKGYLVNKGNPNDKIYIGSEEFYVIFDFDKDMQSFVTWSDEKDYVWNNSNNRHEVWDRYDLHIYDHSEIWKVAIGWANGEVTREGAVDKISELARRIDGKMVYHHAGDNEKSVFGSDGYDNDFDGESDEGLISKDENWDHNYEPEWFGQNNKNSGKAYYNKIQWSWNIPPWDHERVWVDDEGGRHGSPDDADKIAWYFDNVKMLQKDFDPEHKIPDPHQHSLGVCEDYAMLTVGYLRAIGIPARSVSGYGHNFGHAWLQWLNVTGDGEWSHLDTDHITRDSDWEANKFNPGVYRAEGYTLDHVFVRNSEDINDVSNIVDYYNNVGVGGGAGGGGGGAGAMVSMVSSTETICDYEIIGTPIFEPGENSTIMINITNPTSTNETLNVAVILMSSIQPIGGSQTSVAGIVKQLTIPANSEITETFDLAVPGYARPGDDYKLDVYEIIDDNVTLATTIETDILAKYIITTEMPDEIVYEQPFTFSTTIRNNATAPIHNVSVELDTHYYFNATDPLRKEIAVLNAGENHTFTWTLTPIWYGDLRIDVGVSTSDAGFETKMVSVPVLQTPELHITPQVPEKVEKGDDFFLKATVSNSGDIPSDPITLEITTPENVTANRTSVDLGTIGAHENKTCSFLISQNESEDFAILLTATSVSATAENYAFINIAQSDMWIDILKEDETPGIEHHTSVIETVYGEPCNLAVYIKNTGDEELSNVQILTNVGVTKYVGDISEGEARQVSIEFTPTTPGLSGLNVTVRSGEIEKEITRTLLVEKFDFTVSIPKTRYDLNEPVPIDITVTNEVPNMRFVDLKIEINISGSNYNQAFDIPLLSLAPLETKDTLFTWDTTGVNEGTYTLITTLEMADRDVMSDEKSISLGEEIVNRTVSLTANPATVNVSEQSEIIATVLEEGSSAPAADISIDFETDFGIFIESRSNTHTAATNERGIAVANFTANEEGTATITATEPNGANDTTVVTVNETARIPGDVNGDTEINIQDAILLFNWVSFPSERGTTYVLAKPENANVNGDTEINIQDAILLFNWVSFPSERGTTYILQ